MPKPLAEVQGVADKVVEYAYVERVTSVVPNEVVYDENGDIAGYRTRVSVSFELKDPNRTLLENGIVRTGWSDVRSDMLDVDTGLKIAADVARQVIRDGKAELAGYVP